MKKIFKNPILTFIIGAILFSGIAGVTAYTIAASEIEYNGSSVESALNNLYDKATNYKKLDTQTSASTNDIVSGKTAYDNLGNLISGTYSDNCVMGSGTVTSSFTTSTGGKLFDFVPSVYFINFPSINVITFYKYGINENKILTMTPNSAYGDDSPYYTARDGKYYAINWTNTNVGVTYYYIACK